MLKGSEDFSTVLVKLKYPFFYLVSLPIKYINKTLLNGSGSVSAFKPEISIYGQNKAKWNIFSKNVRKVWQLLFLPRKWFYMKSLTSFVVGYFDDFSFCLLIIENIQI